MIETKNLCFKYEEKFVLSGINLNIGRGRFMAVIGANGSGKTTLAKHFNALLLPSKGEVIVDGVSTKISQADARKKVGFVFQNPEDQLVHSIVREDVAFGLENIGYDERRLKPTVDNTLSKLKISHLADENVNNLSAGQKQLAALAGVLAMNPDVIVLDEPTTLLDSRNKKNIIRILKRLNKKEGKTIILITNLLDDLKYCGDAVILNQGRVIFDGKRSKIRKDLLRKAGLDD